MKNFKKLIKEALTPDFLTEYNQTQGREEYRDMDFEVLYSPEDGYSIESERYEIVNPNAYFSTYAEAVEHAELEIDGYLGEWEEDDDLLDDNDSDWVEDPNWAKLEENMALSKELENHPDFDILVSTLEDSLGIEIERSLRSGKYNGREGYYLRTPDVNTWTENAKEMITQALDTASAKAQDHTFEFEGVSDYELEPGERSWDASIEFFINREESVNELKESVNEDSAGTMVMLKTGEYKDTRGVTHTLKKGQRGRHERIGWDGDFVHFGNLVFDASVFDKTSIEVYESVNELDMHDPVLAMVRRRQMQDDAEKAKQAELNQKFGKNWSDKFNSEVDLKNELADLKDEREQMMIDMEQEAEPEGGEIADDYGSRLNDIDARMAAIKSDLDDLRMYESVNEDKVSASSIPEGPQRLKWYGKGLAKMMTPYDTEGPEGLLNALLDNPEDFPLHWDVAHAGTVDYMQDNFDIIVKYANDELGMLESVNDVGGGAKQAIGLDIDDEGASDAALDSEVNKMGYNESKTFDFKKMIKEALTPDYLKK